MMRLEFPFISLLPHLITEYCNSHARSCLSIHLDTLMLNSYYTSLTITLITGTRIWPIQSIIISLDLNNWYHLAILVLS